MAKKPKGKPKPNLPGPKVPNPGPPMTQAQMLKEAVLARIKKGK